MSEWYEVKDADYIALSEDKKFVEILFDANDNGNRYVEVPVDMLVKLLAAKQETYIDEPIGACDHSLTTGNDITERCLICGKEWTPPR